MMQKSYWLVATFALLTACEEAPEPVQQTSAPEKNVKPSQLEVKAAPAADKKALVPPVASAKQAPVENRAALNLALPEDVAIEAVDSSKEQQVADGLLPNLFDQQSKRGAVELDAGVDVDRNDPLSGNVEGARVNVDVRF